MPEALREISYQLEAERGYRSRGTLWSPGYFAVNLRPKRAGHAGRLDGALGRRCWRSPPEEALPRTRTPTQRLVECGASQRTRSRRRAELVLAADQFIMTPAGRVEDAARARAAGDEVRSVIAGYHWFTDWGRDTMISLEGLTLSTGPAHGGRAGSCAPLRTTCATG